jgi:ATP-dependent 26S proteasome regulatory subunit
VFYVPLPSAEEIHKLLRLTLAAVRLVEMINWERIVEKLSGASAAMVVKAAQDAAKAAVLGEKKGVTEAHLLQAVAELRRSEHSAQDA